MKKIPKKSNGVNWDKNNYKNETSCAFCRYLEYLEEVDDIVCSKIGVPIKYGEAINRTCNLFKKIKDKKCT